jgi:hypothetical protein
MAADRIRGVEPAIGAHGLHRIVMMTRTDQKTTV